LVFVTATRASIGVSSCARNPLVHAGHASADRLAQASCDRIVQQPLDDGERGHKGNPASGHQSGRRLVDVRAALDAADHPGLDRVPDAVVVMGVHRHVGASCFGFLDCDGDLVDGELRRSSSASPAIMDRAHSPGMRWLLHISVGPLTLPFAISAALIWNENCGWIGLDTPKCT
jgi:hypothetical protein